MALVLESYEDGVYRITINRPERKNALNYEVFEGIHGALRNAGTQKAQVVVLRGASGSFCSGGDIVAFKDAEDAQALVDAEASLLNDSIKQIRSLDAVVIAAVEGFAVGAGVGLVLACDLAVAAKKTIMNLAYRRIGLTPDGGGSILLSRMVGAKRFNQFYLLSRNITMEEAGDLGLVNLVCEEEEFEKTLERTIADVRALPMETVAYFKDLVNRSLYFGLEAHLDKERFYVAELAGKPLFKERIEAFLGKK